MIKALGLDSSLPTLHAEANGIVDAPIFVPRFLASSYEFPFSAQPTTHTCNARAFLLAYYSSVAFINSILSIDVPFCFVTISI